MNTMAFQITGVLIVCSTVCSGTDQRTSNLRVTGLCEMNRPVTGEFPSQRANNAKNVSSSCIYLIVVSDISVLWTHYVKTDVLHVQHFAEWVFMKYVFNICLRRWGQFVLKLAFLLQESHYKHKTAVSICNYFAIFPDNHS